MALNFSEPAIELNLAGITVALAIGDPSLRRAVTARYAEFIVINQNPQAILQVQVNHRAQFIPMKPGRWIIECTERGGRLHYRSYFDAGWIDLERGEAFLEIAPGIDIENFLRLLYAHLCLRAGGLLLHAAGIIRHDLGYVFLGPSGSGKTTVARLSLDDTVLSDDLIILKIQGSKVRLFGVPFRGDFLEAPRVNQSAGLHCLLALVQAPQHRVAGLIGPEAIARLLACVPFIITDVGRAQRVMTLCREIHERVPVRALHFRPDAGFWREIHEG